MSLEEENNAMVAQRKCARLNYPRWCRRPFSLTCIALPRYTNWKYVQNAWKRSMSNTGLKGRIMPDTHGWHCTYIVNVFTMYADIAHYTQNPRCTVNTARHDPRCFVAAWVVAYCTRTEQCKLVSLHCSVLVHSQGRRPECGGCTAFCKQCPWIQN